MTLSTGYTGSGEDFAGVIPVLVPPTTADIREAGENREAASRLLQEHTAPVVSAPPPFLGKADAAKLIVVARYGREVIDRVRVDEANRLRHEPRARTVVKGSRWLLRNYGNIAKREDRVRLQELLEANKKLATVYILKDDLKHLWDYRYPGSAKRFWKDWHDRAIRSRIALLVKFAKNLKTHWLTILAHCRWRVGTSLLEGINNKIKVIKRVAYGFRDDEYFFLKVRAAFPGILG